MDPELESFIPLFPKAELSDPAKERKALADDIKDIFAEAKSAGFEVKVIKQILRIRKRMNELYSQYTGQPIEEIERRMDRYTFLEANEAKDFGLIDEVFDKRPAVSEDAPKPA